MRATWLKRLLWVGLGAVVGLAGGAVMGANSVASATRMVSYLVCEQLEEQAYLRYRFGTEDTAHRSLQVLLEAFDRHADDLRAVQRFAFPRRRGLAYARWGLVAEKRGDISVRDRAFEKARLSFSAADMQVKSVNELRDMVRAADDQWDRAIRTTTPLESTTSSDP